MKVSRSKLIPIITGFISILICSILIASVGLNANSTPVVIGAMLISPLLGPILGLGFSIATNDVETLKNSFINFLVMVFLSVITAYIFFAIIPINDESSELLSRSSFDIRDVLIVNKFGIPEPLKNKKSFLPDVVLVPLLAFDNQKNRLGYGKGFYDRYLNKYSKKFNNILTVGVAFSFQKYHKLPIDNNDVKLNYILTEKGMH